MLEISIPSSIEYLSLVDTVCEAFCAWAGIPSHLADDISMAVIEAATNAVVHGNKCQRSKKMRAIFEKRPGEIAISVIDEGAGFNLQGLPDPTDDANLLKESGRGIFIMRKIMDEVDFDCPEVGGTKVCMVKAVSCGQNDRILGIDYGHRRLGLALSDELRLTAQPFGKVEEESQEEQIKAIERIVGENRVGEIVIGLPLTLKGDVSSAASRVIAFARELNRRLCISVVTWDERLSTKQSQQVLIELGMKRAQRKRVVDSVAAAVILQSFLDARRNT
jgi:putative Holliday junction resolvase